MLPTIWMIIQIIVNGQRECHDLDQIPRIESFKGDHGVEVLMCRTSVIFWTDLLRVGSRVGKNRSGLSPSFFRLKVSRLATKLIYSNDIECYFLFCYEVHFSHILMYISPLILIGKNVNMFFMVTCWKIGSNMMLVSYQWTSVGREGDYISFLSVWPRGFLKFS